MHNFWWFLGGFVAFPIVVVLLVCLAVVIDIWRYERRSRQQFAAGYGAGGWPGRSACGEPADPRVRNYESHRWIGKRQSIPGEPDEYFTICDVCGIENLGDPAEFPDLQYPPCDREASLVTAARRSKVDGPILQPLSLELPRRGEWRRRHFDNAARLDRARALAAVEFLRGWMEDSLELIRNLGKDNDEWWTARHFLGMMGVRNALRANRHGENELGVDNLDDYAVGLVELAAGLTALCPSHNPEGCYCQEPAGHVYNHYAEYGTASCAWPWTPADLATSQNCDNPLPRCPVCHEEATYQTPDGTYWDGHAHYWRIAA